MVVAIRFGSFWSCLSRVSTHILYSVSQSSASRGPFRVGIRPAVRIAATILLMSDTPTSMLWAKHIGAGADARRGAGGAAALFKDTTGFPERAGPMGSANATDGQDLAGSQLAVRL